MSNVLQVSNVKAAHGLNLYVDSNGSGSKGIIDLRHIEHRDDTIVIPAIISKRATIVA